MNDKNDKQEGYETDSASRRTEIIKSHDMICRELPASRITRNQSAQAENTVNCAISFNLIIELGRKYLKSLNPVCLIMFKV